MSELLQQELVITIYKLGKSMLSTVDSTNIRFSKTCQKSMPSSVDSNNV